MTVKITQIVETTNERIFLRIEGKLLGGDAELLEEAFDSLKTNHGVEIDMSGITFIDSDSASAIRRLERKGAVLTGVDFFIKTVIETYKKGNKKRRNL